MPTLDHVVFPVNDAEKTLHFYRDLLGLPLVDALIGDNWGGYPWLMMIFGLSGRQEIVCVCLRGAPADLMPGLPPDCRHYALLADEVADLARWRDRLRHAGLAFWEETHGERRSLYFPDPDGVILELTWPAAAPTRGDSILARQAAADWIAATARKSP